MRHGQVTLDAKVFQTELVLHPSEVAFDVGTWAHQVSPLMDEEQVGQEAFSLAAGIVVDVDRSVQHIADEAQELVVEVSGIGVHNEDT